MTYQTLYRKYRSQTFADLVGQDATSRALQSAIATDRVAHAYLFSGTRGTGKTSTARLLAKALNCLRRQPGQAEPCNECESCTQIQGGTALDLIEIDAASNRGIDEIRDLREKVNLAPALGRFKVYIIDEAHMLTTEAFNALLKTLEEPPEHVVFVLCTTEANRVPLTVLGRCQQFVFRRLSEQQIVRRLGHIAEREGIDVEPEALELIARVAQGSMRDAVGLLDQLVPLTAGAISLGGARELLGIADPAELDSLLDLVLAGRAGEAVRQLGAIYEGGGELRQVVRGLMERCRDRLVEAIDRRDVAARRRLSAILDGLLHLDGEVRRHAEPRFLVEAALVRASVDPVPGPQPAAVEGPAVEAPAPTGVTRSGSGGGASPSGEPTSRPHAPGGPAAQGPHEIAAAEPGSRGVEGGAPEARPPQGAPSAGVDAEGAPSDLDGWRGVLEAMTPKMRAYFREARPQVDGERLVLTFPYGFHHKMATESRGQAEPLVRAWLGESAKLELRLQDGPPESEASAAGATRSLLPEEDPVVREAMRKLEGTVVRVRRLKEPQ